MAKAGRKRFKTAPVGRRTPGELMGQVSSGQKHSTPMSVAELMKQGKPKKHAGQAHRTIRDLMSQ